MPVYSLEIKLSDTWDQFLYEMMELHQGLAIAGIEEDEDRESSMYCSGEVGTLAYPVVLRGLIDATMPVTLRVDVVEAWLHSLALRAGIEEADIVDTMLFPVRDEEGDEVLIDDKRGGVRDCVYTVVADRSTESA